MNRHREAALLSCLLFAALACYDIHLAGKGIWNEAALRLWGTAIRNADTPGGAAHALTHSFPWMPAVLLWPFTILPITRLPLTPALVSSAAAALILGSTYRQLRECCSVSTSLLATCLLYGNPLFLKTASSGDFSAPVFGVWLAICAAVQRACDVEDARAYLTLAGLAASAWFCDFRFALLLLPFIPLAALWLPKYVIRGAVGSGFLVILFPLFIALASTLWIGLTLAGRLSLPIPEMEGALNTPFVLAAIGITVSPLALRGKARLYATLLAIPGAAACLEQAFFPEVRPFWFITLFIAPAGVWTLDRFRNSASHRRATLTALAAVSGLLWTLGTVGTVNPPSLHVLDADETAGQWLREHPRAALLADDRSLGSVLAFAGKADNLILPDTARFQIATAGRTPAANFIMVPHPDLTGSRDRINQRYPEIFAKGLPGFTLASEMGHWRVWARVQETGDPLATY